MRMQVNLRENRAAIQVNFGENLNVGGVDDTPLYNGDYTITPDVVDQTLPTSNKKMVADVKIQKIPIWEVSNASGGTTINIGKEI